MFTVTLFFSTALTNLPLTKGSPGAVLAVDPPVVDGIALNLAPGSSFYVNITVHDVLGMLGYGFALYYDTSVLTATNFTSYAPFTEEWPSQINDTLGLVEMSYYWPMPEYFGLDVYPEDPPFPVARIGFTVDSEEYSLLDLRNTKIPDVWAGLIPHTAIDGSFVNIEVHDVAVTRVAVNKTLVLVGRSVGIDVTVKNEGTMNETFDVTVYYDSITISPTPTKTVTALVPKTNTTLTFVWDTTGVADGTYPIKANATVTDDANPANNEKIDGSVTVTATVIHDIAVTSVTASPSMVLVTQNVTVTTAIVNKGNIEETFDTNLYYSNATDDYLITTQAAFLMDGASTTLTYKWNTTNVSWGTYTIKANATVTDDVDTTNNEKIDGQVGVALHDTAVEDVSLYERVDPRVVIGETIQFEVRVVNQGFQNATFSVTLYRNEALIETKAYADLRPDTRNSTLYTWNTAGVYPGNYTIKAVASPIYAEIDVEDNTRFLGYDIKITGELHDIAITSIAAPSTIMSGKTVTINITIENQGTVDEILNLTLYYNSHFMNEETDITLEWEHGINSITIIFTWDTENVPLGTYTLSANVTTVENETDTADNVMSTQVTILTHDVAITSLTATPTEVDVGQSVTIAVIVANQGNFTESFTVTVKYDGTVIKTISMDNLEKGISRTLTFTWSTAGVNLGTYTLVANASVVEEETDTADNTFTDVTVTLKPISSIISISVSKTSLTVGETVTINGTITPSRADVTVSIFFRLSGNQTWNQLTTVQTNANSQYSFDWTPTTAGSYEVMSSWTGDANSLDDESDIKAINVEEAPPSIPLTWIAGIFVVIAIAIAIALVYALKIRKPAPT